MSQNREIAVSTEQKTLPQVSPPQGVVVLATLGVLYTLYFAATS